MRQSTDRQPGELSERAQHMLRVLIDHYTRDGQPVGSRTLAREAGLHLSPATTRNVMADLEDMGFVCSPHTSAGRIPTVQGYRFFVDTLLTVKPLDDRSVARMREQLEDESPAKDLLESASNLLSGITRMAGIVSLPRLEYASFQHVEFLPLSENRVLAILVINNREVQNRIVKTDQPCSASVLQQASNYLNELFVGKDLSAVRQTLIRELRETRASMNSMMQMAIQMAEQVIDNKKQGDDYVMAGQTNLMDFRELCDVDRLRQLFEIFNHKREILHLLDQCVQAEGVQIFIGEESGYQVLDECSVVTAPYTVAERVVGVVGIIGPTRMAYERVIPIVDTTARLLGAALKSRD
jgi:heat-inducible transcriptional repressor